MKQGFPSIMPRSESSNRQERPGSGDQAENATSKAVQSLVKRPVWQALEKHFQAVRPLHLRQLFADDPKRGERLTAEAAGIYLDYSKNRVTAETLELLVRLAEECGLRER